ncbi:MAG: hypothetical protein WAT81_05775 [Candidatus Moraniibacteriota bacterium]
MPLNESRIFLREIFAWCLTMLQKERLYEAYVFFFFTLFSLSLYFAADGVFSVDDHFFHIRFAQMIRETGVEAFTHFQSLPLTEIVTKQEHLIYYNFLFYLVLLPFSLFSPLVFGLKLFGVFALAVSLTTVYSLFRRLAVHQPFLWTLFFLVALIESGLIVRFLSARPFALAPVLLLVILFLLYKRQFLAGAGISFVYFYWHTATFFLPILVATAYFLFNRYYRAHEKFEWKIISLPFLGTLAAIALSYLIFPGVGIYLRDITFPVLLDTSLLGGEIAEGFEVYGVSFPLLYQSLSFLIAPLIIFGCADIVEFLRRAKSSVLLTPLVDSAQSALKTTFFLGAAALLVASFFSLRFADYFAYFSIMYSALAGQALFHELRRYVHFSWRPFKIGIILVLTLFLLNAPSRIRSYTKEIPSYLTAQAPSDWMNEHLPSGQLIFNTDWDAFPLFYYFTGDRFRYVTGLEPRFLYDYDTRLYWMWRHIGDEGIYCDIPNCTTALRRKERSLGSLDVRGQFFVEEGDRIADAIKQEFGTDIILVRLDRKDVIELIGNSPRFRRMYSDMKSTFAIYRVVGASMPVSEREKSTQ